MSGPDQAARLERLLDTIEKTLVESMERLQILKGASAPNPRDSRFRTWKQYAQELTRSQAERIEEISCDLECAIQAIDDWREQRILSQGPQECANDQKDDGKTE